MTPARRLALAAASVFACLSVAADRAPMHAAAPAVRLVEVGVHVEPFRLVNGRSESKGVARTLGARKVSLWGSTARCFC